MGFSGEVASPIGHYEEFICAVCQQLVDLDESVVTSCSHVFCTVCMRKWLQRKRVCPTCKSDFTYSSTSPLPQLKTGNPLAWRVLSRVKVRCPIRCGWSGDYSELQSHMTSSSEHMDESKGSPEDIANALKQQAEEKFASRNLSDALKLYTKAILTYPKMAQLYCNRAEVFLAMQEYVRSFSDTETAIKLDQESIKSWVVGAKALVGGGEFTKAVRWLDACPIGQNETISGAKIAATELETMYSQIKKDVSDGKFSAALRLVSQLLIQSTAPNVLLLAARCELEAGSNERGNKFALRALRASSNNPDGYFCMAVAAIYSDQMENAPKFFREGLRLDPDSSYGKTMYKKYKHIRNGLKMSEAKETEKDYEGAVKIYTELVDSSNLPLHSPLRARLFAFRGNAKYRLGKFDEGLQDCAKAIYIQDDCRRAWLTKTYILHAQGKHEEALKEIEPLMESWGGSDTLIRGAYEKAQFNVRKAKRPDYYKLLSTPPEIVLSSVSSEMEIKAAYKKKAMVCHPDRLGPDSSKEDREKAEKEFKLVGEGLEILTDGFQRKLYDEGFDKEAIQERVQRAQKHGYHNHH
mmetsp:Transcript_4796/g.5477  ORF Transcript_4796/g.5477 Transcript_4796/m.5477 type:complete len:579 (+) Transcript_4796:241-1977(+)